MKKIFYTLTISILFLACGNNNLTTSLAENLIEKCLEKEPLDYHFTILKSISFIGQPEEKYLKLENEGLITMKYLPKQSSDISKKYEIALTKEGLKYVKTDSKESYKKIFVLGYKWELEKVTEIHENPSNNTAKVNAVFNKTDISPFGKIMTLTSRNTKEETYRFRKTSDGWKHCE